MGHQEEIRRRVTDEIIAALRSGVRPWVRPWADLENTGMPTSVLSETGRPYSGVNVMHLLLASQERGYQSKFWGTFNAWNSLGFQIKKRPTDIPAGQYGVRCLFCKPVTKVRKDANGQDEEDRFLVMREFVVFNAEVCTGPGIDEYLAKPRNNNGFVDYKPAEDVIAATGATIKHGGNRAVYRSQEDYIQLPPKASFSHPHEYYATAFHELVHYSGHESRLNRLNKLARFGNDACAMEELCAEMGSAFLCAELGIPASDDLGNTSAYLFSWLIALERDNNAIFTASSAASRAVDFILGFSKATKGTKAVSQTEEVVAS